MGSSFFIKALSAHHSSLELASSSYFIRALSARHSSSELCELIILHRSSASSSFFVGALSARHSLLEICHSLLELCQLITLRGELCRLIHAGSQLIIVFERLTK
ncbi:hypothetical protein SLE2022_023000 [Rubroshorea leprosula]